MANSNITKKALAQSFKELGAERILDKITVADITEHCGVNRQTFYYHFNDKYELLTWIYTQELFEPLTEGLSFTNWGDRLIELFKYMKKSKKFLMNTITSSNNYFGEFIKDVFVELFFRAIKDMGLYDKLSDKEKELHAKFFAYGLSGVIVEWALRGMKEDVEELSEIIQKLALNTEKIGEFVIQEQ